MAWDFKSKQRHRTTLGEMWRWEHEVFALESRWNGLQGGKSIDWSWKEAFLPNKGFFLKKVDKLCSQKWQETEKPKVFFIILMSSLLCLCQQPSNLVFEANFFPRSFFPNTAEMRKTCSTQEWRAKNGRIREIWKVGQIVAFINK